MRPLPRLVVAVGIVSGASTALASGEARADTNVIKQPNAHLDYRLELEPHADFGLFRFKVAKLEGDHNASPELGAGFRATVEVADPAFLPKLNDTVGITFGADVTGCTGGCNHAAYLRIPLGVQWNFWITQRFSAFAELGPMLRLGFGGGTAVGGSPDLLATGGIRYLVGDRVSLTVRLGYPFVGIGASIFP